VHTSVFLHPLNQMFTIVLLVLFTDFLINKDKYSYNKLYFKKKMIIYLDSIFSLVSSGFSFYSIFSARCKFWFFISYNQNDEKLDAFTTGISFSSRRKNSRQAYILSLSLHWRSLSVSPFERSYRLPCWKRRYCLVAGLQCLLNKTACFVRVHIGYRKYP
jgi:hypothetical protein